ncbi:hypothetical protein bhn_I2362 [Butyrivibrio hungatei]|uniref:Uncharacterized protein n=1 Tax=Butyrivibrio hungatei TaxID=185008 RepID=A0A1D9P4Y2_9FIRM|nr:hypothetical protein bhn_I2362 [Butyrivibrio hungatei]
MLKYTLLYTLHSANVLECTSMPECERIIQSIEHFYGHLEIEAAGHMGLCQVEYKENVEPRKQEIIDFCGGI